MTETSTSTDSSTDSTDVREASPVFLVGAERSGTTLLRLMLSQHSQLAWCNEFEYAVDLMPAQGWPPLDTYYEWLETHRIFLATGFSIDRSLDYPALVNSFLQQKQAQTGKPLVGATVHRAFDKLLHIWPHARFIHLIRDGRDVARSCIGMGWASNVWTGVERWIEAEQLWESLSQTLPPERWIEVKYESLIVNPSDVLTKICEFIGIDYQPEMLNYDQHTTYSSPNPKLIEQWKKKLSEQEIRLVESRIAAMLTQRGYALSGLEPIVVTPLMQSKLRLQDWLFRIKFRLERFGVRLFLLDFLSRRILKSKQLQKKVKAEMILIARQHIK